MAGVLWAQTSPNPNKDLPINPVAIQILCQYPLTKVRKDMGAQEWDTYKNEWFTFNRVWAFNYTVSTINGLAGAPSENYYTFLSNRERVGYVRGQLAHAASYPTAGSSGVFDNPQ